MGVVVKDAVGVIETVGVGLGEGDVDLLEQDGKVTNKKPKMAEAKRTRPPYDIKPLSFKRIPPGYPAETQPISPGLLQYKIEVTSAAKIKDDGLHPVKAETLSWPMYKSTSSLPLPGVSSVNTLLGTTYGSEGIGGPITKLTLLPATSMKFMFPAPEVQEQVTPADPDDRAGFPLTAVMDEE